MPETSYAATPALQLMRGGDVTLLTDRNRPVSIRQGDSGDGDLVWDMHTRLSERTIRLRYGAPKQLFPEPFLRAGIARMLGGDTRLSTTLIGTVEESGTRRAVALMQLALFPDEHSVAEVAIVVRDDYQREGLGRGLSRMLRPLALARGVRSLRVNALAENLAIMRLIRGLGVPFTADTRRGETTVVIPL